MASGIGNSPQTFYGRKDELQALLDVWNQARSGKTQWVSILAETGVGKTRLVQEFCRCISSQDYLQSKQLSAGEDTDFDPNKYWPD